MDHSISRRYRLRIRAFVAFILGFALTTPASAEITFGGNAAGLLTSDLEQFAALAGPPSTAHVTIRDDQLGIQFGEKLLGQTQSSSATFDLIDGLPTFPLTLDTSINKVFGVNLLRLLGTTAIDGLGRIGWPATAAIGEGALTVLYDADQQVVAFDLLGTSGGTLRLQFFDRQGERLGDHVLQDVVDGPCVFSSDSVNIAAITMTNDDWSGLAYDDFRASPVPSDRQPVCAAGGPYEVTRDGDVTAVALSAGLDVGDAGSFELTWVTDCPSGVFDDPTSLAPVLTLNTPTACRVHCVASLIVDDGVETDVCSASVTVLGTAEDGPSPSRTCPVDLTVESDGAGNQDEYSAWLEADGLEQPEYEIVAFSEGCGDTRVVMVEWTALPEHSGDCSQPASEVSCIASFAVVDTQAPAFNLEATSVVVSDENCDGVEIAMLPDPQVTDVADPEPSVTSDAPGEFRAGTTTTVTYEATDDCGNKNTQTVAVTVRYGAALEVMVAEQRIGKEGGPSADRRPSVGATVAAFDMTKHSCARKRSHLQKGFEWNGLAAIYANCDAARAAETDVDGIAELDLPPGKYLVLVVFDDDGDGSADEFVGRRVPKLRCGDYDLVSVVRHVRPK